MINVHMDKTCCHCEKEHLPCAMFVANYGETDNDGKLRWSAHNIPVFVCCQCLSDAVSAVVAAQMERYRNGSNT